jgi:hypothetical protein
MANYRQIHVSIWKDEWFLDLDPDEKLLFIYLFSNENTSLSGIYKLAFKVICFETCLDREFVKNALDKFEQAGKVYYRNGVVWVKKMRDYNRGGETVWKRILADVDSIPDCEIKRMYLDYYRKTEPEDTEETPKDTPDNEIDSLPIDYTQPTDSLYEDRVKCNEMKCNEMNINGAKAPTLSQNERWEVRHRLKTFFCRQTKLPEPKIKTKAEIKSAQKLWWGPLDEILEMANGSPPGAEEIIGAALVALDQLTIADPNSILKTARSVSAKRIKSNQQNNLKTNSDGSVYA